MFGFDEVLRDTDDAKEPDADDVAFDEGTFIGSNLRIPSDTASFDTAFFEEAALLELLESAPCEHEQSIIIKQSTNDSAFTIPEFK